MLNLLLEMLPRLTKKCNILITPSQGGIWDIFDPPSKQWRHYYYWDYEMRRKLGTPLSLGCVRLRCVLNQWPLGYILSSDIAIQKPLANQKESFYSASFSGSLAASPIHDPFKCHKNQNLSLLNQEAKL